jgi:hypothetical protein
VCKVRKVVDRAHGVVPRNDKTEVALMIGDVWEVE